MNLPSPKKGFKIAHGPNKNTPQGALIFEEAKTEKEARKMFRQYVKDTYPFQPESFKTICYVLPLSEINQRL
jgi:hypothetical protein